MAATSFASASGTPTQGNLGGVSAKLPILMLLILGIALLTLVTACAAPQPTDPASVLRAAYQHANDGDIEAFMALVSPDAVFVDARGRYFGSEVIRDHYQAIYQGGTFLVELSDLTREGNVVTYSYKKYQGDQLLVSGQDGLAVVSNGLIIFDHSKAHPTLSPDSYYSWSTYTSEELGLQIDYPAYFHFPPFSDYPCAPHGGRDEFSKGFLWFGDRFYVLSKDADQSTLSQALEVTLLRYPQLGYVITRTTWGDLMGFPEVTIEDRETLLGMTTKTALFIRNGILYAITARPGSTCVDMAIAQGHVDALTEFDIFTRMFETMKPIP